MSRERANLDQVVAERHLVCTLDAAEIDKEFGREKPELHHRNQSLAASHQLGVGPPVYQRSRCFREACHFDVIESAWIHARPLPPVWHDLAIEQAGYQCSRVACW